MMTLPTKAAPLALLILASPALAQNETALKNAFMGRQVVIRVDMPASHKGVDLRFDRDVPFDLKENSDRIRAYDAALKAGDVMPVTYIKVKGDMIEFHLGGGGFNWIMEGSSKSANLSSKTVRESDLEKEIKNETDRDQKSGGEDAKSASIQADREPDRRNEHADRDKRQCQSTSQRDGAEPVLGHSRSQYDGEQWEYAWGER